MTAAAVALPTPEERDAGIRRYYSLGAFALLAGVPYTKLLAWRHGEHVWVPSPDIQIGRWPGFSLACIRAWSPDGKPFRRPATATFANAADTMRHYGMCRRTLWACIGDGSIPASVVWIDDRPGWRTW
ncbi:hypothetical protein [Nocardia pneumoniae]|uniref:hypothetical protein n=1 Tax=Nocardia pneumoniae TaxID=228601 RepID=UPI00030CCB17|nr:hypothetical protein [Nocardia pneumoniae]